MTGSLTPGGLSERLRQRREEGERRIEAERERYEERIASEFGKLGRSVRECAARELRSIESDLEAGAGRGGALLRKAWARALATAVSVLLGISIGSWGLGRWLSVRAAGLSELEARIAVQETVLAELEEKTWGLELHEAANGKYIVLPGGARTLDANDRAQELAWSVDGQPAIKLALP